MYQMMSHASVNTVICKLDIRSNSSEPSAYNSTDATYEQLGAASEVAQTEDDMPPVEPGPDPMRKEHRVAPICSDPPEHTRVVCHWCVHPFDTPPVGMPTRKLADGRFSVSGVYCSLECAVAHNFEVNKSSHAAYTRHALCCEMASTAHDTVRPVHITPAPPRALLETFGGPMSIQEFRNSTKAYTIVYPLPVVAQVHHAQELSFSDQIAGGRSAMYVPIDEDAIDAFTCGLRRPAVGKRGFKSTLEYMVTTKSTASPSS